MPVVVRDTSPRRLLILDISLREWLAGQALAALAGKWSAAPPYGETAKKAVAMADAVLKELDRTRED